MFKANKNGYMLIDKRLKIGKVFKRSRNFFYQIYDLLHYAYWLAASRLGSHKLIHCIGDSHMYVFRKEKLFVVHRMGPATAYNLINKNSTTNSHKIFRRTVNKINHKKDIALLVFGEIDCRIHIFNQFKKNNEKISMSTLIDQTITHYISAMELLKEKALSFAVLGTPAATKQGNVYFYPNYATPEIHATIYREFNDKLKKVCQQKQYPFIDVYKFVSDEYGFTKNEYYSDEIHLSKKIIGFVKQKLELSFNIKL